MSDPLFHHLDEPVIEVAEVAEVPKQDDVVLATAVDASVPALAPAPTSDSFYRTLAVPHVGYSLLWTIFLMLMQMAVGTVIAIAFVLIRLAGVRNPSSGDLQVVQGELVNILLPAGTLTTLLTAILAARVMLHPVVKRRLRLRRLSIEQAAICVMLVIPLQILASEVNNWVSDFIPSFNGKTFSDFSQQSWPIVFVVMCVLPGIGEEIFFRGFLSRGLIARHGVWRGSLFASLLFGFVHLDPVQASGAFVLGLALQYVFQTTRSLYAPILIHIANNSLAFLTMRYGEFMPIPGLTMAVEGASHTPPLLLLVSVATTIALFWCLYRCRTRWVLSDGTVLNETSPVDFAPIEDSSFSQEMQVHATGLLPFDAALATVSFGILAVSLSTFVVW